MKTKKQLTEEYKRLKFPMGVFLVRNMTNGKLFLDSAVNMEARWNRHRFQLNFGNHPNQELQADWKTFGEGSFRFEVLSELKAREEEQDYREELVELERLCLEELRPFGDAGYHGEKR